MKSVARVFFIFCLSIVIGSIFPNYSPSASLLNTFFTVSGIMFAIGLGLIVGFSPDGVKNQSYLKRIRSNINNVRNNFLIEFVIVSVCFVASSLALNSFELVIYGPVKISFLIYFGLQTFISIFYFSFNFLTIQKLRDDIFDRLLQEEKTS